MTIMRLIAGSGRSGTTWVQDALATANHLRPIFEPLHPYVSKTGQRYAHRALGPDDDHPELQQFFEDVCAGRGNSLWMTYRQQWRWLFPPPAKFWSKSDAGRAYRHWGKFLKELPRLAASGLRRDPLIKCIRTNLMLGWLSHRCECRIVLVVRHPGAVIESELRGGWSAKFALDRFRDDSRLRELTGDRYQALFDRRLAPIEALAARWVIENQWVIDAAVANRVTVAFYERLKSSPDEEWQKIRSALELPHSPAAAVLARPSQQSSPRRSAAMASPSTDPRWMRVLSREQSGLIQRVLDDVEFDIYRMSDPEPRVTASRADRQGSTSIAQ